MNTLPNRLHLGRVSFALLLALVGIEAIALGVDKGAGKDGALVVSVDHVVPEYKAGAKFRSPATIDTALAEDLARRLQLPLSTTVDPGKADLQLTTLGDVAAVPPDVAVIPIGYRAAPMAIMRSDTTIRRWEQLEGRKVCVAQGGNHVGTVANQYSASEVVYPSPTDALVALRTGDCDAMVHDSPMLEELLRLPEWKKFSRRLTAGRRGTLAFLVPAEDRKSISVLRQVAADWNAKAYPDALVKNAVRNIAFEVYLEQDVPDCH